MSNLSYIQPFSYDRLLWINSLRWKKAASQPQPALKAIAKRPDQLAEEDQETIRLEAKKWNVKTKYYWCIYIPGLGHTDDVCKAELGLH